MTVDEIKEQHRLVCKVEKLRRYLEKPVFYNIDYSGQNGLIPYSGNSLGNGLFSEIPSMRADMEAIGKRAIERELSDAMSEAAKLGIEF